MPRHDTASVPVEPEDVSYAPYDWVHASGGPVAVLDGQQEHFVMRRLQGRAVRLLYELPQGTVYLTTYPQPMPQGQAVETMEGNLSAYLKSYRCRDLVVREKGERIAVDGTARDCVYAMLAPRLWWQARHARIGKAVEHEGRTVIFTAPIVVGRKLQLATVAPTP